MGMHSSSSLFYDGNAIGSKVISYHTRADLGLGTQSNTEWRLAIILNILTCFYTIIHYNDHLF